MNNRITFLEISSSDAVVDDSNNQIEKEDDVLRLLLLGSIEAGRNGYLSIFLDVFVLQSVRHLNPELVELAYDHGVFCYGGGPDVAEVFYCGDVVFVEDVYEFG